ncbi:hypothetical protein [Phyllobacterium sp. 22552]|uniref:hypothetical protein n=1 Tax=Phyllobacterium sp. 22552 TaxID=3453941 RepID=UPI003F8358B9
MKNIDIKTLRNLSVMLNGVAIPARSLENVLNKYVTNLVVYNEHPVYKVTLKGSALPVYYRGRYFLVCAGHQLKDVDPEHVSMFTNDGKYLVSSGGVKHFNLTGPSETDHLDVAAFDFTEPCAAHPELRSRFFGLNRIPPSGYNDDILCAVVCGFPSMDQKYELEEKNHLGLVKRTIICRLGRQPADNSTVILKIDPPLDFDPDGLSGGTVFIIQMHPNQPAAYLAGMVLRGGREHLYILKIGNIVAFLDSVM